MNISRTILLLIIASTLFGSCAKIQGDFLASKEWELQEVTLNGGSLNMMESFLPGYDAGGDCCKYYITFNDDGTSSAEYWTNGTLDYVDSGVWEMMGAGKIYIKMDVYVDGVFEFKKVANKTYEMISEDNNIEFYNVGRVTMRMLTNIRQN